MNPSAPFTCAPPHPMAKRRRIQFTDLLPLIGLALLALYLSGVFSGGGS